MRLLVTGTTAGIGAALARRLVAEGHQVWGVARRAERLAALRQELGSPFSFTVADVADPRTPALVAAAVDQAGFFPDAVVLNAGIYPHDSDQGFDFPVAARVLQTNLTACLALVAALLPVMQRRGHGQFLAVSSTFALRPDPVGVGYAASKAGLTMAFRSLAQRNRNGPIRFKIIVLGPIATPMIRPSRFLLTLRSADQAARAMVRALDHRRTVTVYPFVVGAAMRATAWLPDSAFTALTRRFRRAERHDC